MKYFALALIIGLVGCAHPASIQTPAGKAAYTADQVVVQLGTLQTAAIQLNNDKVLSDASTRVIVKNVVDTVKTLKTAPEGLNSVVSSAMKQLLADLPPQDAAKVQTVINVIKAMVGAL